MEPTLIKNNKVFNNQKKIIVTLIIFLVCLFIGTSYSILTSTDETEEVISFQAGDLNLEVKTNTDTSVNFPDELPKSEEEVEKPVILNIKNTGSLTICEYRLKLVADTSPDSPASDLPTNYIRYAISKDNGVSYNESKLLSETNNQIFIGFNLKPTETKTIYVKVWLDEEVLDNKEVLNKHFYGKIDAELLQRCESLATEHLKATIGETGGVIGVTNDSQKVTTNNGNIREYRYSGLGVNNYVTFNNELWRILGVFKDETGQEHVKIVRNEVLPASAMPDTYEVSGRIYKIRYNSSEVSGYWNYDDDEDTYDDNNWADAGLMKWLNSKGTTDGYLKILTNDAQNMIADTKYHLGTVTWGTLHYIEDTAIEAYKHERTTDCIGGKGPSENSSISAVTENSSCRVWKNHDASWTGQIAVMYPSDFGFSADSQYWNTILGHNSFEGTPSNTSWLQQSANHIINEWTLSPTTDGPGGVAQWDLGRFLIIVGAGVMRGVRPALYLKSDVKIIGGNGTSSEPYQLQL